jgi:hypothetical protein
VSAPSFVRRPTFFQLILGEFRSARRPSADFSDIRWRASLRARAARMSRRSRPDAIRRLEQEVRRFDREEFRLEQVTALRQIAHLRPILERELPKLDRRRAARAAALLDRTQSFPDPEEFRRRPLPPIVPPAALRPPAKRRLLQRP